MILECKKSYYHQLIIRKVWGFFSPQNIIFWYIVKLDDCSVIFSN